jgi:hypothetical protein
VANLEQVSKVWVLDTETKGTGANMVPLERTLRKPGSDSVPEFVLPKLKPPASEDRDAPPARLFKVVDLMTREVLGEGLEARAAIEVLEDVERIVDVTVYVWEPTRDRWRRLTFGETAALWEYRGTLA